MIQSPIMSEIVQNHQIIRARVIAQAFEQGTVSGYCQHDRDFSYGFSIGIELCGIKSSRTEDVSGLLTPWQAKAMFNDDRPINSLYILHGLCFAFENFGPGEAGEFLPKLEEIKGKLRAKGYSEQIEGLESDLARYAQIFNDIESSLW